MLERHPIQPRLFRCDRCGEWSGIIDRRLLPAREPSRGGPLTSVLCRCDGPLCRRCGKYRIHRPISNYYDDADGSVWHVPYFAGLAPCPACRQEVDEEGEDTSSR
jgi:hypothetical protein